MENKIMLLNDLDSILSMAQCYMFNKGKRVYSFQYRAHCISNRRRPLLAKNDGETVIFFTLAHGYIRDNDGVLKQEEKV